MSRGAPALAGRCHRRRVPATGEARTLLAMSCVMVRRLASSLLLRQALTAAKPSEWARSGNLAHSRAVVCAGHVRLFQIRDADDDAVAGIGDQEISIRRHGRAGHRAELRPADTHQQARNEIVKPDRPSIFKLNAAYFVACTISMKPGRFEQRHCQAGDWSSLRSVGLPGAAPRYNIPIAKEGT